MSATIIERQMPSFSKRESVRIMLACWAALLDRKCTHPLHLRFERTGLFDYDICNGCSLLVRHR